MVIFGGIIIPDLDNARPKAFFGVGFGVERVPIDILPIYQLSCFIPEFTLLIVDEFLKLNGLEANQVESAKDHLLELIGDLSKIYGNTPHTILCSEFMQSEEYRKTFKTLKTEIVTNPDLENLVLETVPESKKHIESARDYPIHQFACVKHLSDRGFKLKIGPTKEQVYDVIMQMLGFNIDFAYILDAYALGTKSADKVVHYIPNSRGPNNGQRIFFGDSHHKVKSKLQQGCDEALRYFCKIASVSGIMLNQRYLASEEISGMYGKKLKREAIRLVLDNIIKPYMEVK